MTAKARAAVECNLAPSTSRGAASRRSSDRAVEAVRREPSDDGRRQSAAANRGARRRSTAVTASCRRCRRAPGPAARSRECRPRDLRVGDARRCATSTSRASRSMRRSPARPGRARRSVGSRGAERGRRSSGRRRRAPRVRMRTVPGAGGQQRGQVAGERVEPGVEPACFAEHESGAVDEAMVALQALRCGQHERQRRVLVAVDDVVGQGVARACRAPRRESHATRTV